MEKDNFKTEVVFRMWGYWIGNIRGKNRRETTLIALFPYHIESINDWNVCSSYMYMGEHSGASYQHIISQSRPATLSEYSGMKNHLENKYGYNLKVIQKRNTNKTIKQFKLLK